MDPRADAGGQDRRAHRPALRWPVLCWLVILVLIGIVQLAREEWFDAAVFLVAVGLVVLSILLPQRASQGATPGVIVASAAVLAAGMSLLPRHSVGMVVAVLVTGAVALLAAWPGVMSPHRPWTRGLRRLAVVWAVVLVVGCLWELAEFIAGLIAPEHPSFALSDLVDPLLDSMLGKAVFALAWLVCGVFLALHGARRGRAR